MLRTEKLHEFSVLTGTGVKYKNEGAILKRRLFPMQIYCNIFEVGLKLEIARAH